MIGPIGRTHLMDYWAVVLHRRWVLLLTVLTFTVVAVIAMFTAEPQYRATTTLHIEHQSPDIFTFRDLGQSERSWTAYADFYQTQYNILASPAVARRAADRLAWTSQPAFTDPAKPGLITRLKRLIPRVAPVVQQEPLERATAEILAGLEVSPERNSQLVHVSWVSADPEWAGRVANAMAAAYIAYNIQSQYATTHEAQEFLVDQIAGLKAEISTIETSIQEYGENKRILSLDDSNNITLEAVKDTSKRRTAAQTRRAEAEAVLRSVQESEPDALTQVLNSDLIARLRQEYAGYEAEYAEQSRRFGDDWPGMQVLKSKLAQAGERLDKEVARIAEQVRATAKTGYDTAFQEVQALDRLLTDQERAAQRLKRDGIEFADLSTDVETKRETLDGLLRRQLEMALSSQLKDLDFTSTNIRIVEKARTPTAPFSPNPRRNLMMALVLGLAAGLGLAFLLDYLDNTVSTLAQLTATVSLPLLAVIPRHREPAVAEGKSGPRGSVTEFDLIAHKDSRAIVSEAYRELRTAILLSNPGEPPRRLMVTSALPEEGKTATVINLAIVLSQLGRRVVLVDTDLRRPRLHKVLNKENRRGVSTYLSGLEQDPAALTFGTGIENLDLIPSGPIPPNPSELLDSERFVQLADALIARGYDHVLFDSPPALSVSDPVIIASNVDVGILVARAAKTPRQSIRLAAEKLQHGNEKMGVVLNDLNADRQGAAYYRYQYYGRYGEDSGADEPGQASGSGA